MPIHHFTLIVDGPDLQDDAFINALFESGCDDATVGRSQGVQFLDFDREATSRSEAIRSAVADVERVAGVRGVRETKADVISNDVNRVPIERIFENDRILIIGISNWAELRRPVTDRLSRHQIYPETKGAVRSGSRIVNDPYVGHAICRRADMTYSSRTIAL